MITKKIEEALNLQMNREFYNARLYYAMAAYFDSLDMPGATAWMEKQAEEENGHALRFYEHIKERGGRVRIGELAAPPVEWDSPLAAFEAAYEHECRVSREMDEHWELAESEKDNATKVFLHWFVDEQVEEESSVDAIIQQLKRIGDSPRDLFLIDRMLAKRGEEDDD